MTSLHDGGTTPPDMPSAQPVDPWAPPQQSRPGAPSGHPAVPYDPRFAYQSPVPGPPAPWQGEVSALPPVDPVAAPPGYAYAPPPAVGMPGMQPPLPNDAWGGWGVAPTPRRTSGWAIATLVLSLTFWPAVLITGPVALAKTRRGRDGGRGLAIAGVVLSVIWTVVTVGFVALVGFSLVNGNIPGLAAVTQQGGSPGTSAAVSTVPPGACFASQGNKTVPVDCAFPHDGEVFFIGAVVGTGTVGYPGEPLLVAEAEEMCYAAFAAYVGLPYEQSQWHFVTYIPDEDSWHDGDRQATCAIVPFGPVPLVGSAAGSAI